MITGRKGLAVKSLVIDRIRVVIKHSEIVKCVVPDNENYHGYVIIKDTRNEDTLVTINVRVILDVYRKPDGLEVYEVIYQTEDIYCKIDLNNDIDAANTYLKLFKNIISRCKR